MEDNEINEKNERVDLFDLDNLSDIPRGIRSELSKNKRDDFEKNIIDIFKKTTDALNLDQIQVAYYRLYKEEKSRKQLMTKLYNMSKKSGFSAIERVSGRKGVYKLKEGFEN